ncbi:phospholipase/Carboxylesterase [Apiospora marii]|uniref:Phospholipase/Carboxylesterase n=1 Tax=Apiospora marii TaxID=335849 RepID=A0ABR1S9Z8_9PEZI
MLPAFKVCGPTGAHTHTVIFLHGRDSGCAEFADEFFESETSAGPDQKPQTLRELFPTVKWVFPGAPVTRSARFDSGMSQWFDMWSVEDPEECPEIQRGGLRQSIDQILSVVREEEAAGVPRDRIFLGGISQGFATAMAALFAEGQGGFAGMVGLCSWMPFATPAEESLKGDDDASSASSFTHLQRIFTTTTANKPPPVTANVKALRQTPILITHSLDDEVVPVQNGRRLRDILQRQGFVVEWKEYPDGGHWVNEPQGVDDMAHFLRKHMNMLD